MEIIGYGVLVVLMYIGIPLIVGAIGGKDKVKPKEEIQTKDVALVSLLNIRRNKERYIIEDDYIPTGTIVSVVGEDCLDRNAFNQGHPKEVGEVSHRLDSGKYRVVIGASSYYYKRDALLWETEEASKHYDDPTFIKKEEALIHALVMPYTSTLRTLVNDKETLPEHKYTEVLREIRKEIQEAVYAFGELEKTLQEELEDKLEKSALERLEEAYHEDRKVSVASTTKDNLERMLKNLKGDDNNA